MEGLSPAPSPRPGNERRAWRLAQVAHDSYQRSKLAGFLYLFGWSVVAWLAGAHVFAPWPTLAMAAVFLLVGLLRLAMRPPAPDDAGANQRWLKQYALVLPLAPLAWSAVQGWMLLDPRFGTEVRMVSLIATIGYATVFVNVYTTVRGFAVVGATALFLPTLIILWLDSGQRALAVAMSFYAIYLVGALLRTHAEYRRRLDLDMALREQRDLYEGLSRIDPLTGVCNRRHFGERLDALVERARAEGAEFCLLILDVDHFKHVNDRYGHAVGDACLRALATRMQQVFTAPRSLLARLGGEEFGVLFEGGEDEAREAAERLRSGLVASPLALEGRLLLVTASIGLGRFDPDRHGDADGLYRAVDGALYAAKQAGRDRIAADA
ncbi:diguanylate cyclase domain-containing protein [Arenimonas sp.]|uniref:GGDEF domain-containing protein n=1 Tax=Arenimonas sp. TaxID=1872635 RepID=UPI0035B1D895